MNFSKAPATPASHLQKVWTKGVYLLDFLWLIIPFWFLFSENTFAQPQADSSAIKTESMRLGINTFSMGTVGDGRFRFSPTQKIQASLGQYWVYNRALPANRFITNNFWASASHSWKISNKWMLQNEFWQNTFLANQTRLSQGISRIRFLAWEKPGGYFLIRAGAGILNDRRMNFDNTGPLADLGLEWVSQSADSLLQLRAMAEAMAANISPRTNQKGFGQVGATRTFDQSSLLSADLGYQYRKVEDYLGSDIQSIISDSLFARLKVRYNVNSRISFSSENEFIQPNRAFQYRNIESGKENRNVFYLQQEWQSHNRITYQSKKIKAGFTAEIRQRNRDYDIRKRFSPADPDYFIQLALFNQRLKDEQIKDIQEQFITYTSDIRWRPTERHNFRIGTVAQLLRVDTRSELNNQDRDEILYSLELGHEWKLTPQFSFIHKVSASLRHLIFIEASQSSENFKDRILRWEPGFRLRLPKFTWSGTSGIWATYQVRDFDSQADRNRSNRVLIFTQQAEYRANERWRFMADLLRRENRLSQFNWERFSESPIDTVVIYDLAIRPQYQLTKGEAEWAFQVGYRAFWQVRKNRASLSDPALGSRLIYLQNYIIQQGPQIKLVWNRGQRLRLQAEFWLQWSDQFFRYQKTDEIYFGTSYSPEALAFKDQRFLPYFNIQATWYLSNR